MQQNKSQSGSEKGHSKRQALFFFSSQAELELLAPICIAERALLIN